MADTTKLAGTFNAWRLTIGVQPRYLDKALKRCKELGLDPRVCGYQGDGDVGVLFSVFVAFVAVLMLHTMVTATPLNLRSGLGPFAVSLRFLFLISLPFGMLLLASLPLFMLSARPVHEELKV